ncbi:RNA polymerase sigma factor SigF [Synechococcus elongatus]|uniref:Group3 RNA polymerase sigma factor SigF2 n=1 Tax=Synechococcus sp. (strain ATCC 27144 / PCC 6301 / SAUG 1402/1) TaxID=269084 RepID=A0A0H3K5F1_SYNP6|nr:RNA polymerase sigma factor SigF [Synechococcus elongatus]UOW71604.1 sigma-70 family RNA polymerase sigma factor [Synechococcus elongatus PCC 7943]UOW77046.1 sigma-70 family RNA polymerase sigma factor [Synechococcus elongatus PCC 6301]MBD2586530.1 RNA polymerase sigma factor SigF [Synechococcus elongatus FACHB-242]MBD2687604.1 RNA polymerase sigma factor SigF [Synechococcus elongatus FACHB-1061]MBD2706687.1 RNA polymerase sigma factor SigF [Synechococcus elongatus PCC 7942 = FACHB-805]
MPKFSLPHTVLGGLIVVNQAALRTRGMELLVAYAETPSIALRNQIVQLNLGLVRKIAHRLSRQCSEPYEDLEQIGFMGLIRAIERFQPHQGCAFSSFAVPYIRGEILHFLRDSCHSIRIPRRWQELQRQGQQLREVLRHEWGRAPTEQELAFALNLSMTEWQEIHLARRNRMPMSLDATLSQAGDSSVTLVETLPDTSQQWQQAALEERQQLVEAIGQLEEKARTAIESVYLRGLTRKEAAQQFGISPMTITRRINRGVQKIAEHLDRMANEPLA